ncbi:hypothetical protein WA026_015674 [Henosepilachna vigintioctopunctata]|uniref:Uncharacterized protein n=1 Tax=Henosepilachna vigintioctopunctata TaxID=420089 RepID=A0AAW1V099_9CUCU
MQTYIIPPIDKKSLVLQKHYQHEGVCIYINKNWEYTKSEVVQNMLRGMTHENIRRKKLFQQRKGTLHQKILRDFQRDLYKEDWYGVYEVNDADEQFGIFLTVFCLYCVKLFPMKCMNTIQEYKPSQEERHMKKTLDLMGEAYEQNRNVITLKEFKEYKKHYIEFAQKNRRMVNKNRIINADNNQRATWQIINTETGKTNNKYTRSKIHCEVFNKIFESMGQNIIRQIETTSKVL